MLKQFKDLYEKHFLDIIVILIVSLFVAIGIFTIKKSKEKETTIEITGDKQTSEVLGAEKENDLININEADTKELEKLPGIGEKTAESIISFRDENGLFKTKEDLKDVSGIGDAKYGEIEELITAE